MRIATRVLAIFLSVAVLSYAQGNTFDRVRYNGGTVSSKVGPKDWGNHLAITSDRIVLTLNDGQKAEIDPKSVTSLSYGQEAHRRVGTMVALAVLVAPVALFGLFHKTRLHYIGIQYTGTDGKSAGVLLQGDKDNYRAILVALQSVSGAPVSVGEKDREFIPVGLTTSLVKGSGEDQGSGAKPATGTQAEDTSGTVNVTTVPDGADVYADEQFVGNAPASLKLKPGKHTVSVRQAGYKDWTREIEVQAGSEVKLRATLVK